MASTDNQTVEPMTGTDRLNLDPQRATAPTAAPKAGEFRGILFDAGDVDTSAAQEPRFFADLNLDQVVEAIVAGHDEYELKPFFYAPLRDEETIDYRHEVFRELEREEARAAVRAFGLEMRRMRQHLTLAKTQRYKYEKERWFLDAAAIYCGAVSALSGALAELEPDSRGFTALRDYLSIYATSERFTSVASQMRSVMEGLDSVTYTVRIKGAPRVTVSGYQGERDYSVEGAETFARFREGTMESHLMKVPDSGTMDHVEARISQLVARLHPESFRALDEFCARHHEFLDRRIVTFDREVQFYLAYLEYAERLAGSGVTFCYPTVSGRSKDISAEDSFDIALAAKLASERVTVIRNDFSLAGPERILVVTGPNQGGKTTFARMFGQLHYLGSLGVPVPGRVARLFLPDRLFTHFEKEEDIATLRGKLDDELVRMRDILEEATGDSVVVINEILASTTLADAVCLGQELLGQIVELGCLAICVTFVDELASLCNATVSMVATVAADDPSQRTFKIVRKPADGRAYAWAIADKYGLSDDRLRSRISR